MKLRLLSALAIAAVLGCSFAAAQVPRTLNYQGYLTTPTGAPVNTPQSLTARIYDATSGGNLLFTETHNAATMTNGIFNILLGSVNVITNPLNLSFSAPYYLGITVGTDAELSPRQPLAASPYALRAATAEALAATATVPGSQITGAVSSATKLATARTINGVAFDGTANITVPAASGPMFAMFFGLTSGTGNGGPTDYAATVPVKTLSGSGRVPFPQDGPLAGGIVRVDASSFTLPAAGTYEITFRVHTTESGQLQLELNGLDLAGTVAANLNPMIGGHPISGNFFITTTSINSTLAVVNPVGNATSLTITPANGATVHANTQSLTIKRIN